jgi:glutaredoxin
LRISVLVLLGSAPALVPMALAEPTADVSMATTLEVYTRQGCPHCAEAKAWLAGLERSHPALQIEIHDVGTDLEARARLEARVQAAGLPVAGVPAFAAGDQVVVGFSTAEKSGPLILSLVDSTAPVGSPGAPDVCLPEATDAPCEGVVAEHVVDLPVFGQVDVIRLGLPLFTIVLGLVDGFNPCAMWVLLFLLSMLVGLKDRGRMVAIAGTFVVVSGLVYFGFMAAWLNFFFLLGLSRGVQVVLAVVALGVAAVNIKDFFAFKKGLSLSIPESAKPKIYARARALRKSGPLLAAIGGAAAMAVLVNLVELLCTAGLPAVYTQVLARQDLSSAGYYGYLALYNVAYMVDDGIMVGVAVATLSRTKLQQSGGRQLKLVSGLVMATLGLLLLFKPEWLVW